MNFFTIPVTNKKYGVNSWGSGVSARYATNNKNSPFDIILETSWFKLNLLNNQFRQFDGPTYQQIRDSIAPFDTTSLKPGNVWRLQAQVSLNLQKLKKNPDTSKITSDIIFVRTYIYSQKFPFTKSLKTFNNSIFQLQIGYRKDFDDFFKLFTK